MSIFLLPVKVQFDDTTKLMGQVTSKHAVQLLPPVVTELSWCFSDPMMGDVQRVKNWQSTAKHQGKSKITSQAKIMPEMLVTTISCQLPYLQHPMPSATG